MSLTAARALAGVYFTLMLIFVTWPGLVPFARVRPLVLGLPFSMAWIAAWIAGGVVVLAVVDRVESRYRRAGDPRATPGAGPTSSSDEDPPDAGGRDRTGGMAGDGRGDL